MAGNSVGMLSGFRRRLVARLATVGLAASLLAGVAAYFIETERLDETLVDQAELEARSLVGLIHEGSRSDREAQLAGFLRDHASSSLDFFVLAEIYDPQRNGIAEASLPDYAFVETYFDRAKHQFPDLGGAWYAKRIIKRQPYLQVMVPLPNGSGGLAGWFEGIYRISPQTQAGIQDDIMRIVALAVAAVALTAAVLYPLMSSLQGHIVAAARDLLRANIETLKVLGNAIAKRDSDTNAHNFRVTVYAVRIAEAMGLGDGAVRSLIKGSFLHDVGKIAVPDAILLKPGKLDEQEYAQMKTHVPHGLDIIAASGWLKDAVDVVGGHHEKVDGTGYPRRLKGDDVPLAARIFAVADVFDALTSKRPYKEPLTVEATLAILEQGRGRHFDSTVLDAFLRIVGSVHAEVGLRPDDEVEGLADAALARYFGV